MTAVAVPVAFPSPDVSFRLYTDLELAERAASRDAVDAYSAQSGVPAPCWGIPGDSSISGMEESSGDDDAYTDTWRTECIPLVSDLTQDEEKRPLTPERACLFADLPLPSADPAAVIFTAAVAAPRPAGGPFILQEAEARHRALEAIAQNAALIPGNAIIICGAQRNPLLDTFMPTWTRVPRFGDRCTAAPPAWASVFTCDQRIGLPFELAELPILRTSATSSEFFSSASLNPAAPAMEAMRIRNARRANSDAAPVLVNENSNGAISGSGGPVLLMSPSVAKAAKRAKCAGAELRAPLPAHLRILSDDLFPGADKPQITLYTLNCPLTRRILTMISHDRDPRETQVCGLRTVSTSAVGTRCDCRPIEQGRSWAAGLLVCLECAPALVRVLHHVSVRLEAFARVENAAYVPRKSKEAPLVPAPPPNTVYRNVTPEALADVLWFVEEATCLYTFKRRRVACADAESAVKRTEDGRPVTQTYTDAVVSLGRNHHLEVDITESMRGVSPSKPTPAAWSFRQRQRSACEWPCPSRGIVIRTPQEQI